MQVFTSYFAKINRLPKDVLVINIARYAPKGVSLMSIPELSPTPDILFEYKKNPDEERYVRRFWNEVLRKLNPDDIVEKLAQHKRNTVVLCCYERSGAFCHRHEVMKWLTPALESHGYTAAGEYVFK